MLDRTPLLLAKRPYREILGADNNETFSTLQLYICLNKRLPPNYWPTLEESHQAAPPANNEAILEGKRAAEFRPGRAMINSH